MNDIDFVMIWVDGNDPDWQRRKAGFLGAPETDDRPERYRDWGLLPFWFRGVETFAPWVRTVWFVCDQEPPAWLNRDHPKLRIVRHEDYLPEEYRPAFSSHPIELNLHRIRGLSDRFVYFNDDMYLISPVQPTDFFRKGLPVDSALLNPVPTLDLVGQPEGERVFTIPLNNAEYLNRNYRFRDCIRKHPGKWLNLRYGSSLLRNLVLLIWPRFVGFDELHLPQPFLKGAFEEAWKQYGSILDATSRHALRNDQDVNQWLIRETQLAEGRFSPGSPRKGTALHLPESAGEAARTVREQRCRMLCINDGMMNKEEYERIGKDLLEAFEAILPRRSSFERAEEADG